MKRSVYAWCVVGIALGSMVGCDQAALDGEGIPGWLLDGLLSGDGSSRPSGDGASVGAVAGESVSETAGTMAPLAGDGQQEGLAAETAAETDSGLTPADFGEVIRVASGFELAESPLWDHCAQRLIFTDVVGADGNGEILALGVNEEVSVLVRDTANANGMAFDVDGSLVVVQMGRGGNLARFDANGQLQAVATAPVDLHTPDDVIIRSDGAIYFTDGEFAPIGSALGLLQSLPVYLLAPGSSELTPVTSARGPNGIELSPDERYLYVNAYSRGTVLRYDVAADGSLSGERELVAGLGTADSLCLDAEGNLYIAAQSGVVVTGPDGREITRIALPESSLTGATNCGFGGPEGTTLYITTFSSLYKIEAAPIPGLDWVVNRERARCGE